MAIVDVAFDTSSLGELLSERSDLIDGSGGLETVQNRRDAGVQWSSGGGVTTGHPV